VSDEVNMRVILATLLAAAAIAGPVPAGRYRVLTPNNQVSLHGQAKLASQNFAVKRQSLEIEDIGLGGLGGLASLGAAGAGAGAFGLGGAGALGAGGLAGGFGRDIDDISLESSIEFNLGPCPNNQLRHGTRCVVPKINRNIFVFGREDSGESKSIDDAPLPIPTVDYNIIFVRSNQKQDKPFIAPPPQKKTIVYVLEDEEEPVIHNAPVHPEQDPEVYYVKVKDGENPKLPGGIDLETAYQQALQQNTLNFDDEVDIELNLAQVAASAAAGGSGFGGSGRDLDDLDDLVDLPDSRYNTPALGGSGLAGQATGIPLPSLATGGGASPVGVPLPNSNFRGGLGGNLGGSTGVPLPSFGAAANTGAGAGFGAGAGAQQPVITMEMIRQALLGAGGLDLDLDLEEAAVGGLGK